MSVKLLKQRSYANCDPGGIRTHDPQLRRLTPNLCILLVLSNLQVCYLGLASYLQVFLFLCDKKLTFAGQ